MNQVTETGRLNLEWATTLAAALAGAGVREAVISPGSRSTPLTLACLRQTALRCTVVVDERSAAWFALGRARADGRPVALVCTSGTAVANWLPAVVEANHARLPLILLSADRPPELQQCGANQTIDQDAMFAGQTRAMHNPGTPFATFSPRWLVQLVAQAVAEARWPLPGPVHLNLPFREPLLPTDTDYAIADIPPTPEMPTPIAIPDADAVARLAGSLEGRRGIIVCGGRIAAEGFAAAVTLLAERLACPILADPHSGLRFGPHPKTHLCTSHERWLRERISAPELQPAWVLRFGDMPVTRTMQSYLAVCDEHYVTDPHGRWPDPLHRTRMLIPGNESLLCEALASRVTAAAPAAWFAAFASAESGAISGADAPPPPQGELFAALCRSLPGGTQLFCGNSLPIRDLAAWSGCGPQTLHIHANRGASGIDGNIATAAGLADSAPTVAVIGDLTAQHDLGSLVLMRNRPFVVIVINNGGGGIFEHLPPARLPEFEAGWLTPQNLSFEDAAHAFGIAYQQTADPRDAAMRAVRTVSVGRPALIELIAPQGAR